MKLPGRNDLCWCGSKEKYKKCHAESDSKLIEYENAGFKIPNFNFRKTEEDIEGIRKAGLINIKILDFVENNIKEGIKTNEIDKWVVDITKKEGGITATLGYEGYPKSVCTSINEVICHGIPSDRELKNGDIVNVDVTTILNGYYADSSRTFMIGECSEIAKKLVNVSKQCLNTAIENTNGFMPLNNIGKIIEQIAEENGFSVVKDFGGHGIGKVFHDFPHVDHFYKSSNKILLIPNMVFTIEPMINEGVYNCKILKDKWTTVTTDGKLSSQFEHTVVVREDCLQILT